LPGPSVMTAKQRLSFGGEATVRQFPLPGRGGALPLAMDDDEVYLASGGGALVDLGGLGVQFKVRGERTGRAFAVVEHPISPGILVEPHIHRHEDELSYVLAGTVWARG